jgi:hypothetical protein
MLAVMAALVMLLHYLRCDAVQSVCDRLRKKPAEFQRNDRYDLMQFVVPAPTTEM